MIAALEGVTYRYPAGPPVLRDIHLTLPEGALAVLAGPSGGGKSTLLRLFNGLVPQFSGGELSGRVCVAGLDAPRTPARRMATVAGMVFQEPEAQSIADTVEDEIAFGMEQQGVPPGEMRRRLESLIEGLAIGHLRTRTVATLSGGERQRVAIAAVLALEPRLLLLDEPTSQLDGHGATALVDAVERLRARRELTVVVAEHRLERLLPAASLVIGVDEGRAWQATPREAAARLAAVPPVCELGRALALSPLPLSVAEARTALQARQLRVEATPPCSAPGDELLRVEGVSVRFGELAALDRVSLSVREGEVVAVVGANGSGKTTLFRAIAGLIRPADGTVRFRGVPAPAAVRERTAFAGMVPQDPAIALYHETVGDELAATLHLRRLAPRPASALAAAWDVAGLEGRHPRDLSVGQQQRLAIGAMLAHEPPLWLLDEPTRGADGRAKAWLAECLRAHAAAGGAALVSTHDRESAATYATRVIGLEGGRIAFDLPARAAFAAAGPLPTQVAQCVPGAITPPEVVAC